MSSSKPPAISTSSATRKLWLWAFAIAMITLVCYAPLFSNTKEFTNWDDDQYITDQPLITSLDAAHIKALFAPGSIVVYNYHPLTMLSLAFDYRSGYDEDSKTISIAPFVHTNIVLHLLNTVLVFLLIYHLCRKKYLLPVALAALLFGIHPLHVESVAWMSERKDLLYCFFFPAVLPQLPPVHRYTKVAMAGHFMDTVRRLLLEQSNGRTPSVCVIADRLSLPTKNNPQGHARKAALCYGRVGRRPAYAHCTKGGYFRFGSLYRFTTFPVRCRRILQLYF